MFACFPATAPASDLLAAEPDGVFLSNGPGDPAALDLRHRQRARRWSTRTCRSSASASAIRCLSLAMGGETYKLKFGHRGANHPVKQLDTGQVEITSQNHGFAVDPGVAAERRARDARQPVRRHRRRPAPHGRSRSSACNTIPKRHPGPHDADYLFDEFLDEMERRA